MIDEAALNNAEWCQAMCAAHGRPGAFGPRAWTNTRRTPLYYPDAVTLTDDASVRDVLDSIDRETPGATVKDSFARLDLAAEGFRPLFDARWIHRPGWLPPTQTEAPAGTTWRAVGTPEGLLDWALAWSGGDADEAALFRAGLLTDPYTRIVAGYDAEGRIAGGAVLTDNWRLTGISNLFAAPGVDPAEVWAGCLTQVDAGSPVVGYESGDDLPPALAVGFEELGPLRVWLAA
ncbi:hypothetical protein [Streptomyces sp. NPDC047981]|uniref:hypothetical protein n=1 Tax=Streptomyces sp. NPDC047981 TaxID=3154610 RepID=UPI00341898CB